MKALKGKTMSALLKCLGSAFTTLLLIPAGAVMTQGHVRVTLGATAVVRGEKVLVQVQATPKNRARYCTYWLTGGKRTLLATRQVRHGAASIRVRTENLKPGRYRAAVFCGRAGRGRSGLFSVTKATPTPTPAPTPAPEPTTGPTPDPTVPPAPRAATCGAVESGWTYRASQDVATAGFRLVNTSSTHDAVGVLLEATFWSGSTAVTTVPQYLVRIPAGQSLLAGFADVPMDSALTGVTLSATCDSEPTDSVGSVIRGSATAAPADLDELEVRGQFTNTYPGALSPLAYVDYVTRDDSGHITGGGYTPLLNALPQGVTRTWQATNLALPATTKPAAIDFTVEPYLM